jgi:hypothetical protein
MITLTERHTATLIKCGTLTGGDTATSFLYGDAYAISGNARGGNDTLRGGKSANNEMYDDAYAMSGSTCGGDDTLRGGGSRATNLLYRDAYVMSDDSHGGNDTFYRRRTLDTLIGGQNAWHPLQKRPQWRRLPYVQRRPRRQ